MERYSILRVIGEGSFVRALLVRTRSSQEEHVLKEIRLPKSHSKLEDSRREAILLSRMKHPNIVAFREAFEVDGLLCVVMEFCSGGDLLQRIKQQKSAQFCVNDILRWFSQMCAGARYIHDKRVLHRDLKSKNIFLTENGTVKVGDFGSACILNSSKAYAQTYVGTPYYVAPEIWENKPYNNKSDVWSLGCVLYELCTLRHPFQASSWKNLILKVCRGSYPPLPRQLPYELHYLVKHIFKTNPKDRPSLNTILTSHRVSKLLRPYSPPEVTEVEERRRPMCRWNRDEGKKVADLLGEKSLIKTSTFEGSEFHGEDTARPRKQWALEPSDSVMEVLANASLMSSESMVSMNQNPTGCTHEGESIQRRRWEKDPPEELLLLLEKAEVFRAFSTFLIHKAGDDPLIGPLSQNHSDDTDGSEQEKNVDEHRLEPRSDDEDTDFEEESSCNWMEEVEKLWPCTETSDL
ncbi:serine/threonine-protein kinase Nek3 isoform X2 [Cynoglossus semilaevis]|uniref:serine/threonine-protein kinase Nek3 isoform X2 n=1 Tax=Cynoglossus semilaevis TaxID=244447 RepID=UPI0007DC8B95|nr:serine/threonine-protein kinase Nek3 isoform X2 [Cynoglossus semilaevis]